MRVSMSRALVAGALLLCLMAAMAMAVAAPALADSVYPSQHIPLISVDGAPLASGFVENIHTNGPRVFAHERYVLIGAAPATEYQATIQIYDAPDATVPIAPMQTVAFTTNGVGNGVGRFTLMLSGVPAAFHGLTLYLEWELSTGGVVAYKTARSAVVLD